ncbi:MAG: GxxExxY protein [Patescibacteria group bacterium]
MPRISEKIIFPELSFRICGLCFDTHNRLGRYRSETSYGDALETLLKEEGIPYERELRLPPSFKGEREGRNRPDFIIDDKLVLELKTKPIVTREDYDQVKRYLAVTGSKLGILVNFRSKYLTPKRVLK